MAATLRCWLGRARLPAAMAAPGRFYRAAPLRRWPGPLPRDPSDPKEAARLYGRLGEASGVAPERLWPSPEQLREMEAEQREWEPPLRETLEALELREREEQRKREERQQLIARKLAEMPAQVAAWRLQRAQAREQAVQAAARRRRLLAEAGLEGAGAGKPPVKGSGPQRQELLLEELEQQQRREEKRQRRQRHDEVTRRALAEAEAAAAARPPPPGAGHSSVTPS